MEMEDNMQDLIRIGTRKSRLALVQTNIVRQKIEEAFPGIRVEICEMSTKGDELLDRTLTVSYTHLRAHETRGCNQEVW